MSNKPRQKRFAKKDVRDTDIIYGAFDTETRGLGGELLAITAYVLGSVYYFSGDTMLDEFAALFFSYPEPVIWYAHHAQYDWRYFIPYFIERGYEVDLRMRTETDIYMLQIKQGKEKFTMRDSMALFPGGLDKMAEAFCPEFPKLTIDVANFNPENPEHIEYAKRDSLILGVALPRIDSMLRKNFGTGCGHTTAGTAVNAWSLSLPDEKYFNSSKYDERESFIREGYYGGLVFLTRNDRVTSTNDNPVCETYDINSSYPSVMCDYGVPTGRSLSTKDYKSGKMGIYRVRVKAPSDLIIPILAGRNSKGNMQWRRGTFDTVATSSELIFASNHDYKILEIYEGIAFDSIEFPFNDFISTCKKIRKEHKDEPEEALAKLMQNSLYGKFGARRERLSIFHPETSEDMLGAIPLENLDYFWIKKELDETMRCIPEWAVFITAHARLRLLQAAYAVGIENVFYGDTDSLTIAYGHGYKIDVGDEYGQFKLEKEWRDFRAIAPKVYAGELMNGVMIGAVKGIPKRAMRDNPEKWGELLAEGHIEGEALSLASLRVGLSKGLEPAKQLKRKSTSIKNSANWEVLQNNKVRPKIAA
jgi:hypothetical protein